MADIKIVIQELGKSPRESIHPESALTTFQRIWKNELIDYYFVDENGNRIKKDLTPSASPKEKALEAMRERAKSLGIKGYQKMHEDTLLKAIQEASKVKAETK